MPMDETITRDRGGARIMNYAFCILILYSNSLFIILLMTPLSKVICLRRRTGKNNFLYSHQFISLDILLRALKTTAEAS